MLKTAVLIGLTSLTAHAAGKCLAPDQKLVAERDAAVSAAEDKALAKKGWRKVELQELGFSPQASAPSKKSQKQQIVEQKLADGGVYARYLILGAMDAYVANESTFVKDKEGRVFPVQLDTKIDPTRVVTFCGCAPITHGGAPPPSYLYGVQMKEGENLTVGADPNEPFRAPGVEVTAKTVKILYAQTDCPKPP